ncbi:MAG: 50S ribosomal protein L3 [Alphaproteobacteria bacterium]|nr:50S ribosomal protein L3 [Alphaproteobacteria bacterium]
MRTGVIAQKVGMTSRFDQEGKKVPVTILLVDGCQVIQRKQEEGKDGYNAVQVGVCDVKPQRANKPKKGHFAKAGIAVKKHIKEFRVAADALLDVGTEILVTHFVLGQFVDVQATTKGKGFAGVMKRWNFGGLRATHGVSVSHRSHGSTGQRQDPGRVFKNKKMAGHLGVETVTVQNLEIIDINVELRTIAVKGAVPGNKGGYVYISDAIKRLLPSNAPYPTAFAGASAQQTESTAPADDSSASEQASQ